ncbi:MAG: FKBP-type peptidyl-prolyl cis-trans isomerase, partial [Kibdelosporangium sp.]
MRIAGKVTIVALAAAAAMSACANSEQDSTQQPGGNRTTPSSLTSTSTPPAATSGLATAGVATAAVPAGNECKAEDIKVDGEFGAKPTITIPATCQPPKTLLVKDLKPGTGAEARPGSTVEAFYQLVTWSDKKEADGNFGSGQPFPVENIGQARVIDGWNEGLAGIKAQGRRLLVVPPDKGYGQGGQGIKPNETLVF